MSEPNDPACPECGTPRAADGTPACPCTRRASEARREARTAEAAAAEDFDPVRLRPFVDLGEDGDPPSLPGAVLSPAGGSGSGEDALTSPDPAAARPAVPGAERADASPRPARSRTVLLTASGATLAVLLTGAYLGGMFTYDNPARGDAAPGGLRAPVPTGSAPDGTSVEGGPARAASVPPPPDGRP
ncbi:peptidoglycan-binding membrane protein, partial [Streptomyces zinciresistens K42]